MLTYFLWLKPEWNITFAAKMLFPIPHSEFITMESNMLKLSCNGVSLCWDCVPHLYFCKYSPSLNIHLAIYFLPGTVLHLHCMKRPARNPLNFFDMCICISTRLSFTVVFYFRDFGRTFLFARPDPKRDCRSESERM
jgi:hypothetical protein